MWGTIVWTPSGERKVELIGRLGLTYTYLILRTRWLSGKESACSAGDLGSIPGSGRSPRGGHGKPLQYSCLENPMDRGVWQATVHGIAESDMTEVT